MPPQGAPSMPLLLTRTPEDMEPTMRMLAKDVPGATPPPESQPPPASARPKPRQSPAPPRPEPHDKPSAPPRTSLAPNDPAIERALLEATASAAATERRSAITALVIVGMFVAAAVAVLFTLR